MLTAICLVDDFADVQNTSSSINVLTDVLLRDEVFVICIYLFSTKRVKT
jgi:hypothetical protein